MYGIIEQMDIVFVYQGEYEKGDAAFPRIAEAVKRFLVYSEEHGMHGFDVSAVTGKSICRNPEGRPMLLVKSIQSDPTCSGLPRLDVSVTHSGDIWMCLVSDGRCGVDFQYMRSQNILNIVGRFYTEGEREYIEGGGTGQFTGSFIRTEEGRDGRFFDIWVRREALGKYEGHGFFGNYPDSAPGGILTESLFFFKRGNEASRQVYIHEITPSMLAAAGISPGADFKATAVTESDTVPLIMQI